MKTRCRCVGTGWGRAEVVRALVVVLCVGLMPAAGAGDKPIPAWGKPGRTVIGDVPWDPAGLADDPKVIYGDDNRRDVYEETNAQRVTWAASTCALVEDTDLRANADGTYELTVNAYTAYGTPPCEDEPYADQPSAAFCTGFVVGSDLIATAGHCVDEQDLPYTRFVFGFAMADATTPVTTFDADQVYTGVEVVAHQFEVDYDYSIVRVDRPIAAPGAQVLDLRRSGTVPIGTRVGVIGHPAGLPTKIAFGTETVVRSNWNDGYFVANLDTYGGNSGSPVFNADTGLVEGVLVFGEEDFEFEGDCFRSIVFDVDAGDGEGVSKSTTFAAYVRRGQGQVNIDKARYQCEDTLEAFVTDQHLSGAGTLDVAVTTDNADAETMTLAETAVLGTFTGTLPVQQGAATPGNAVVDVQEWAVITATYHDADAGEGLPAEVTATAVVDCVSPTITHVSVGRVRGHKATISFETDEPCVGAVRAGRDCAELTIEVQGAMTTSHFVTLAALIPLTTYRFVVEAADIAGNVTVDTNEDLCYTLTTTEHVDRFSEGFFDAVSDLVNLSVTFMPDDSASGYHACVETADDFPTCPTDGRKLSLGDDDFVRVAVQNGQSVVLYGEEYDAFYVGSNGYVTFDEGDWDFYPTFESHYSMPRVSGYFSDLFPPTYRRPVSVKQLDDRVAVTYEDIPDYYWYDSFSFQIELFFDGAIRITWLAMAYPYGIVGLSDGNGISMGFDPSDLSAYGTCDEPYSTDPQCRPGVVCNAGPLTPPRSGTSILGAGGDLILLATAVLALAWAARKRAHRPQGLG